MKRMLSRTALVLVVSFLAVTSFHSVSKAQSDAKPIGKVKAATGPIVLVVGEVTKKDKLGHHDYLGGCKVLDILLRQSDGVQTRIVENAWPDDLSVFDQASSIVFYTDGGGKQAFLDTPERIATMDKLAKRGCGLVFIHQAVDFPEKVAEQAKVWLGGVYVNGKSGRGHWPSSHVDFPEHPVTRGVTPWKVNDGWLNKIDFVKDKQGITPLVWSGKTYEGSRSGLDPDIVAWTYDRPEGGRSFSFTGLDAHSAWSLDGMRQLMVNGVLWTAHHEIPASGAPCKSTAEELDKLQTPRDPK